MSQLVARSDTPLAPFEKVSSRSLKTRAPRLQPTLVAEAGAEGSCPTRQATPAPSPLARMSFSRSCLARATRSTPRTTCFQLQPTIWQPLVKIDSDIQLPKRPRMRSNDGASTHDQIELDLAPESQEFVLQQGSFSVPSQAAEADMATQNPRDALP